MLIGGKHISSEDLVDVENPYTGEVIDTVPIAVVKRDGRREFFDKHKLAVGIDKNFGIRRALPLQVRKGIFNIHGI